MTVREVVRLGGGLVAAVVIAIALAVPAGAKGPTAVTIVAPSSTGHPEGMATELPAGADPDGGDDDRLMLLAEDMGVWEALDPQVELPQDPPSRAGVAFPVVWTLAGPESGARVEQTLYPQASGGPLVHTEPDQTAYGQPVGGGWYRASSRLMFTLDSLGWSTKMSTIDGAPAVAPSTAARASDAAGDLTSADDQATTAGSTSADDPTSGGSGAWRGLGAATVGVALLVAVVAVDRHRRGAVAAAG